MKKHGRFVAGVFGASVLLALGTGAFLTANDVGAKEAKAAGETNQAEFSVTARDAVEMSGVYPVDSSATFSQTYSGNIGQITKNNSATFTWSSLGGIDISKLTLSMKSNKSAGAGTLTYKVNDGAEVQLATGTFNSSDWAGKYSTSYIDVTKEVELTSVDSLEIVITATTNSLYVNKYTIDWTTPAAVYDHIAIVGEPQKEYALGDSFSTDGLEVYGYASADDVEGTLIDPADIAWSIDGDNFDTAGTKTVSVVAEYNGMTSAPVVYDDIQVIDKHIVSISVSGDLENKNVEKGDPVVFAGLVATAHYNDGSDEDVSSDVQWASNFDAYDYSYITELDVIASIGEISSPSYKITGISVSVVDSYLLAEDDSDVYDGAVVAMVSSNGYVAKFVGDGNYVPVDNSLGTVENKEFIPNENKIDTIGFITLEAGPTNGQYYLKQGDVYLTASSTSANNLTGETQKSDKALFNISVVDGVVEATNIGNTTKDILSFNALNPRFSCYGNKQENGDVLFYVLCDGEPDLDENAAAFRDAMLIGINCDPTGVSAPSTSEWESAADAYEQMLDYHKDLFSNAAADEAGNVFEQVAAKYDYILSKYGVETYSNFMNRDVVNMSGRINVTFDDANTWFALAGILAIGAAASAALVFANRRRKAE